MPLYEEYWNQHRWRKWEEYVDKLPIKSTEKIIDLGCSFGGVCRILSEKAHHVIGVDINIELLDKAAKVNSKDNIDYKPGNLKELNKINPGLADGMWSSFVASYFPDFTPVLNQWLSFLRPGGWIALVEMSDLFGHSPLSGETRKIFIDYYKLQRESNLYDFEMGSRLREFMLKSGLEIIYEEVKTDPELSFAGPAPGSILESWSDRFNRMTEFEKYVGVKQFKKIKNEFLECLCKKNHTSKTTVHFVIGQKPGK